MAGLKASIFGSQIGENLGFFVPQFLGGTYEHPYMRYTISGHNASCGEVSRKSTQGRRKIGGRKKKKNNTAKT